MRGAASVRRLRPRTHDRAADALQLVLELPLALSADTRAEVADALSSYAPEPWPYVMLNRANARAIVHTISTGPRSGTTLAVWMVALSYVEPGGDGEVKASRAEIAAAAGTTEQEVSRALARLARIGALVQLSRGRYALHPEAAWNGSLAARERAAAAAPAFKIVANGQEVTPIASRDPEPAGS